MVAAIGSITRLASPKIVLSREYNKKGGCRDVANQVRSSMLVRTYKTIVWLLDLLVNKLDFIDFGTCQSLHPPLA